MLQSICQIKYIIIIDRKVWSDINMININMIYLNITEYIFLAISYK